MSEVRDVKTAGEESRPQQTWFPGRAMFEVTKRCVQRCVHCYIDDFTGKGELNTEEAKSVLRQLFELNCLEVTFTGGEVFMRKDFMELLRYARELHFSIVIYTEANLINEEVADQLKAISPWRVEVTLLGPDAELHDRLTQVKGSFARTLKGIRLMLERGVKVTGKTILMQDNIKAYPRIRALFEELGVNHFADPLVTPKSGGDCSVVDRRIGKEEMKTLLGDDSIAPGTIMLGTSMYTDAMNQSRDLPMCKAGLSFVHIDADGSVLPCVALPLSAGNVRQQPLREIWENAELFQKLRRTTMKDLDKCSDCDLYVLCYRCPGLALLEDGDMFGPSRTGCLNAEIKRELQLEKKGQEETGNSGETDD
jgi:radical SAM protein with 4Fe4S-binding SPASM domain